uniref:tRNA threonylcarbamoyladenosine biosynthesis protein TsaE n=2 Tax=Gloeothece TaxID=28070 RepID=E0UFF4_GLOV7|nr:protein of unknown function UPF0079 [Gloeothece verrucosa PCC 7822]
MTLPDSTATYHLGKKLGENLPPLSVVLLFGDLGAGKTTLVQGIGEGLAIEEPIVSPTFTLINEYHEGRLPLYHFDLYRLQSEEIKSLYLELYWDAVEVPPGIMAIEWAQRLPRKPPNYLELQLTYLPEQGRQVQIQLVGKWEFNLDLLKLSA